MTRDQAIAELAGMQERIKFLNVLIDAGKPTPAPENKSRAKIIAELHDLSARMLDAAVHLDYFGGFDGECTQHASELAGASSVILTWADGLEENSDA